MKSFLAVTALVALCGCNLVLKPSERARHASFAHWRNLFTADLDATSHQTFIVVSGEWQSEMPSLNAKTGKIVLPPTTGKKTINRGLAVAIESDGYLLTAGHVLGRTNFVCGEFDGRFDVRPARVVFQKDSKFHADFALIKVSSTLNHCATYAAEPKVGDRSFAVVCYRGETQLDVVLDFAAGTVRSIRYDPSGYSGYLIDTDVPLWYGDSGGPLFSSAGRLIGITTGYKSDWHGVYWKYRTISFFPETRFVQSVIERDRASERQQVVPR
jgi:S1-C subfamily serine protease